MPRSRELIVRVLLSFVMAAAAAACTKRRTSPAQTPCPNDAVGAVTVIDPTHCSVPRDVFFGHDGCLTGGPRPEPVRNDGGAIGVRFTGIHPKDVYTLCGVRPGDVWIAANGMPLTSPDRALEAYATLRRAPSLRLDVLRDGHPVTLRIDFE